MPLIEGEQLKQKIDKMSRLLELYIKKAEEYEQCQKKCSIKNK